jgi:anti-sigma B factor antagonist
MERPVTHSLSGYTGTTLHLSGEVDLLIAPVLRRRLHAAAAAWGAGEVVVDLSAVTFMDCAGMGPLLEARTYLDGRLRLRGLPESLVRILQVCDLRSTFTILDAADALTGDEHSREDEALHRPFAWHRKRSGHTPPHPDGRAEACPG